MNHRGISYKALPLAAILAFLVGWAPQLAYPQEMDHAHMQHMAASGAAPARTKGPAEIEADKRFSEFNHRFAGAFVLLVGLLALVEPRVAERRPWVRYLWSLLFFVPGVYLILWSDPESWPTGNQTLWYVITENREVLQHKVFSLLLLGLGIAEFIRVRKNSSSLLLSSVFPILAGLGAILLLFHVHGGAGGMSPEAHLSMQKIEQQHLSFAVTGFGIALTKAVSDVGRFRPRLMRNLFAVLTVVLAVLLLSYTE